MRPIVYVDEDAPPDKRVLAVCPMCDGRFVVEAIDFYRGLGEVDNSPHIRRGACVDCGYEYDLLKELQGKS